MVATLIGLLAYALFVGAVALFMLGRMPDD